eukprot:g34346.t1
MEKCLFSPTVGRFWGYHFIPNERPLKPSWLRFDCFGRLSHTGNVLAAEAKQANVAPTWRCKRCRGCSMSHDSKCVNLQICARIPTVLWFPILFQHYVSKLSTQATTNADSSETEPNRKRKRDSRGTRMDLTSVDPKHRKRLEKRHCRMLLSSAGERMYPETSALLRKNKAQAAAASAIKEVLQEMPARAAHKQAIVGKLRGRMTTQEWNDYFKCVSRAYANKAAKVEKQLAERKAKGDVVPIDIFAQNRTRDEQREGISQLEKLTTKKLKVILEMIGAKSGRTTLYWYGTLDSFHDNYRDKAFPTIFEQMVIASGSVEKLVVLDLRGTQWVTDNSAAYICGGKCSAGCQHFYKPRTRKTLTKLLADEKVSFRCITKTVPCKWHNNYDKWKLERDRELDKLAKNPKKRDLINKKLQTLNENIRKCERHFRQYETQRR